MHRLTRWLRAPRTALGLILVLAAYIAVVTGIPQASADAQRHAEWLSSGSFWASFAAAIGLDRAYTNPAFLTLAALLTGSTAMCAWSRTRAARRRLQLRGSVDESVKRRLNSAPGLDERVQADRAATEAVVTTSLSANGMKVRRGPTIWYAEKNAIGLLGSPVFHWSLVALVIVIAAGQLTRWEGLVGVPVGQGVLEQESSYGKLMEAPLALPHTDWLIEAPAAQENMVKDGVNFGIVPLLRVRSGEAILAEQQVYANNPLPAGPITVHLSDHGLFVRLSLSDERGREINSSNRLLDFDESSTSGTTPSAFTITGPDGALIASMTVEVDARDADGRVPRLLPPGAEALFTVEMPDGGATTESVRVGDVLALPDRRLVVEDIDYYVRLSVVRDWSVPWIYGLLGVLLFSVGVALVVPYEAVWIRFDEEDGLVRVRSVSSRPAKGVQPAALSSLKRELDSMGASSEDS